MFDLISIGDARVDNYYFLEDATLLCRHNHQSCEICFGYGDKIPVSKFQQMIAGNNANNSVGSARLGLKVAMYGHVGNDASGEHIINVLKKEKVDTRYLQRVQGMDTENSAVITFKGERTIFAYHQPWDYSLPDLEKSRWVYFSSVSYSFSKSNLIKELEQYIERTGANLAFSPGSYQLKHGVKKFPRLLSLMKIIFVNLEEAKMILGLEEQDTPVKKLLKGLSDLGPSMVVITNADKGSYGFDGQSYFHLPAFHAKLVEMTGAGDAYATATLAGLVHNKPLSEAMCWGDINSAAVIEQVGAQSGLLTLAQIENHLKAKHNLVAKVLK